MEKHIVKINLLGGIVSPGDLLDMLSLAEAVGVEQVRFGNRQQMFFLVDDHKLSELEESFLVDDIDYEINSDCFPNIVSSYVTEEILNPTNWLREGVYKDILNAFNYQPKLKVNIVDQSQNLVPFFTGHLNFISSEVSNFWFLHIRFPKSNNMFAWPLLVYTEDIAQLCKVLEEIILNNPLLFTQNKIINASVIFDEVVTKYQFIFQEFKIPLAHTEFQLPYYEGFNGYNNNNKLWLGIYRRKEEFSIAFLKEVCQICAKTRLGQLYTTPWKSLVIKNINIIDRKYWSHLLNKFRVNVRHAANELNWSIEDACEEALNLKIDLVERLEAADLRTYLLCFAIKTKPHTGLFGSIIIKKREIQLSNQTILYEVLHTKNFNPNNKEYILFASPQNNEELANSLIALCDYYYSLQLNLVLPTSFTETGTEKPNLQEVYQCQSCKTIYDINFGDEFNHVLPGTNFVDITHYQCPVCAAPKENFIFTKRDKMLF